MSKIEMKEFKEEHPSWLGLRVRHVGYTNMFDHSVETYISMGNVGNHKASYDYNILLIKRQSDNKVIYLFDLNKQRTLNHNIDTLNEFLLQL